MKQLSLLEHQTIGAPHNGTDESIAAAVKAGPKQGTLKERILTWLTLFEDVTQDEMSQALFRPRQSMTAPFNALVKEGQIRKLDGVTRTSQYGSECAVYVLAGSVEGSALPQNGGHPVGWDSRGSHHDPAPAARPELFLEGGAE